MAGFFFARPKTVAQFAGANGKAPRGAWRSVC
jgi:hypothetical protein